MKKIEDEFSHIEDRNTRYRLRHPEKDREKSKRYQIRHPEKWKKKQRRYLATAKVKFKKHQMYLDRGQYYEGRQSALKEIVKRSLAISLQKLKEMAEEESFQTNGMGKAILLEDLEILITQCNKYITDTSKYRFSMEER